VTQAFSIGPYTLDSPVVLAPMAGITDYPFRKVCRRLGAGLVVSEMTSCHQHLQSSTKTRHRLTHQPSNDAMPHSVQIVGTSPATMAEAARTHEANGADIIDINMGCPAKKVCKKAAGSALLKDEKLVAEILNAVVNAVSIPVTLKIRTGWSPEHRNAVTIARIAEDRGIAALAIHGRTRACLYKGHAESYQYPSLQMVILTHRKKHKKYWYTQVAMVLWLAEQPREILGS